MKQRVEYIDRLKGFAILCVVIGHFTLWAIGRRNDPFHDFVYLYHMPLFFFLSGIVISAAPKPKKVLVKACQFLCPFFFVGGLVYSSYIKGNFHDFIWGQLKYGYWYLQILTLFYILLLPFHWSNLNGGGRRSAALKDIVMAMAVYAFLVVINSLLSPGTSSLIGIGQARLYWPYFILGFFSHKYQLTERLMSNNVVMSLSMVFILPACILYFSGFKHIYNFLSLAFIIVFVYLFKSRESKTSVIERELARIGRGTLDVYIFHYFVISTVHLGAFGQWLENSGNWLFLGIVNVSVSIVIAYVCVGFGQLIRQSKLIEDVLYGGFIKKIVSALRETAA